MTLCIANYVKMHNSYKKENHKRGTTDLTQTGYRGQSYWCKTFRIEFIAESDMPRAIHEIKT